jgi:murein DD-endopeptidase MepM/ murein hydrolase activator NlpD
MTEWLRPVLLATRRRRAALALALAFTFPFTAFSQDSPAPPKSVRVGLNSSKIRDGHLAHVRIRIPREITGSITATGTLGETEFAFYERSVRRERRLIGLFAVPFNTPPGPMSLKVRLRIGDEQYESTLGFEVVSGNYRIEVLPVDPKFVTISPEDQARIEADSKIVGEIYRNSSPQALWTQRFQKPIASGLTSRFGNKRMFNGELQSFHTGADLRAATGTEVQAAAPGNVVLTKDLFFTGNTVIIDHGLGLFTVYAHLSSYRVKEGQNVQAGQVIAESGSTGRSSGPHLHWGAVLNRVKFDPMDLLKVVP